MKRFERYTAYLEFDPVSFAICAPANCSTDDLNTIANRYAMRKKIPVQFSFTNKSHTYFKQIPKLSLISLTILVTLVSASLFASIFPQQTANHWFLKHFNCGKIMQELITVKPHQISRISYISGIKVLYAVACIYSHIVLSSQGTQHSHAYYAEYMADYPEASVDVANGLPYSTSINFVLGGLLCYYSWHTMLVKVGGNTNHLILS